MCLQPLPISIFSMLVSLIMVLAISCKVLFFLSTTPFCCEVIGQDKSWEIPFSSNRFSKYLFSNYPPWSLLTLTILRFISFWTWVQKVVKTECDSSLCLRNFTHVHMLQSSIMTNPYFFPLIDAVFTGPNKSMWRSSNDQEVETTLFILKKFLKKFLSDMLHKDHLK